MQSIATIRFSAIARSVMISHQRQNALLRQHQCFSAIARSVMISPRTELLR